MNTCIKSGILAVACLTTSTAMAGTHHFTPAGSGSRDGSSFENALSQKSIQPKLDAADPGDVFLLGSGIYRPPYDNNRLLVFRKGGTAREPIEFRGVDTGEGLPVIQGRWQETNVRYHAHSSVALAICSNISHLTISGLRITSCMRGVTTSGDNSNLHFRDIHIHHCREGFRVRGLHDSTLTDCSVIRYTKRGVRMESDCNGLRFARVNADATGGDGDWPTEAYPFGFSIEQHKGNHDIVYQHCTARNNLFEREPSDYWNGDGFVAENASHGIVYEDCVSINNTDGGWDDKSRASRLVRCRAEGNKRGFRVWNAAGSTEEPTMLEDCVAMHNHSRGGVGSSAGLWSCGAVQAVGCTFGDNATAAVALENNNGGAKAVLKKCCLQIKVNTNQKYLLQESGTTCKQVDVAREVME